LPEQGKSTLTVNTPTHREITSRAKGEGKKIYEFVDEVWSAFKAGIGLGEIKKANTDQTSLRGKENYDYILIASDIERELTLGVKAVASRTKPAGIEAIRAAIGFAGSLPQFGGKRDPKDAQRSKKTKTG